MSKSQANSGESRADGRSNDGNLVSWVIPVVVSAAIGLSNLGITSGIAAASLRIAIATGAAAAGPMATATAVAGSGYIVARGGQLAYTAARPGVLRTLRTANEVARHMGEQAELAQRRTAQAAADIAVGAAAVGGNVFHITAEAAADLGRVWPGFPAMFRQAASNGDQADVPFRVVFAHEEQPDSESASRDIADDPVIVMSDDGYEGCVELRMMLPASTREEAHPGQDGGSTSGTLQHREMSSASGEVTEDGDLGGMSMVGDADEEDIDWQAEVASFRTAVTAF